MKNVLIVDDDKNFLLSLADMFKPYKNSYSILTAYDGMDAISELSNSQIDLVVTDLKMPGMDGFGLLAYLSSHHHGIPVIVMTAFSSPETSDRLDTFGIFQYIEKPIDFDQLLQKIAVTFKSGSKGHIAGVSLASFLQLLGLDSKTCTLKVSSGEQIGLLYFKQGELFDAFTGNLRGLEAALEIVTWEPVEIEIENYCRKAKRVIEEPLGFILIEGARRKDEKAEGKRSGEDGEDADRDAQRDRASEDSQGDILSDIDFNSTAPPPDLDLVGEVAAITGDPAHSEEMTENLDLLVSSLESLGNLQQMAIMRKDGELLASRRTNEQFGYFVCKTAIESLELGDVLNLEDPQYIALTLEADRKIIIFFGMSIFIGIEIQSEQTPAALKANLGPVLRRVKFD